MLLIPSHSSCTQLWLLISSHYFHSPSCPTQLWLLYLVMLTPPSLHSAVAFVLNHASHTQPFLPYPAVASVPSHAPAQLWHLYAAMLTPKPSGGFCTQPCLYLTADFASRQVTPPFYTQPWLLYPTMSPTCSNAFIIRPLSSIPSCGLCTQPCSTYPAVVASVPIHTQLCILYSAMSLNPAVPSPLPY